MAGKPDDTQVFVYAIIFVIALIVLGVAILAYSGGRSSKNVWLLYVFAVLLAGVGVYLFNVVGLDSPSGMLVNGLLIALIYAFLLGMMIMVDDTFGMDKEWRMGAGFTIGLAFFASIGYAFYTRSRPETIGGYLR